jgi:glycosyltransferase involved in cell wall biosynthesis
MSNKYRFHVLCLPHTQVTKEYDNCAFTAKCRKFCDMMKSIGHTVYVYGSEEFECRFDRAFTCITKSEQKEFIGVEGPTDIHKSEFNVDKVYWKIFNERAVTALKLNVRKHDFICVMGGRCHLPITSQLSGDLMIVEFGIGYPGSYAPYRVFESYAWMHMTYGREKGLEGGLGNFYDRVIPSYFEEELFPLGEPKSYFAFVGRITENKGWRTSVQTCEAIGAKLVMAGIGPEEKMIPGWVDYVGLVGPEERGKIMSEAIALFAPTIYVEPFGSVVAEALMCGTPVITTDWGAFPELVRQHDGNLCRTLQDFVDAANFWRRMSSASNRDARAARRERAQSRFAMRNVKWQYECYFDDLYHLWTKEGWNRLRPIPAFSSSSESEQVT